MSSRHTVLVVDDEEFVRNSLVDLLESEGYRTTTASTAAEAIKVLGTEDVSTIVTDLRMPAGDGHSLLEETRRLGLDIPVILLTGVGTVSDAVRAMKSGAYDFVQKPVDPDQFVLLIERSIQHRGLVSEVKYLRSAVRSLQGSEGMIGDSTAIQAVRALIQRVARTNATVLITGESGTGKELAAAEIHQASARAEGNFVRVNCAAIPESLFESEFFGHRRGAFTSAVSDRLGRFAEAERGTLALDEIGTLKPEMQAKLLRVLETGEYQVVGESRTRVADVRVVAITNDDLAARVREGAFRADLYYRLNVFPIHVPPLRERVDDIPRLAVHFANKARADLRIDLPRNATPISDEGVEVLKAYDWPGNIRELRNLVERAVILAGSQTIEGPLLRGILGEPGRNLVETVKGGGEDLHLRRSVESLERRLVTEALAKVGGKKREAAALLGIDPKNLSYYLRKHGISEGVEEAGP